jgi:hypothetical protein
MNLYNLSHEQQTAHDDFDWTIDKRKRHKLHQDEKEKYGKYMKTLL